MSHRPVLLALSLLAPVALLPLSSGGCDHAETHHGQDGGAGSGGAGGSGGSGGSTDMAVPPPGNDFPSTPIVDNGAPADAPTLFGDPSSGEAFGGPCLSDPQIGALLPQNFLRPRFSFNPVGGQNLFEIRMHTAAENNDLVVYTTQKTWTMPSDMWHGLLLHTDTPITVTIRGAVYSGGKLTAGPSLGSTGDLTIAPSSAPGAIVYWAQVSSTGVTTLKGFNFGDENPPRTVLTPPQASSSAQCVACHASTPDGMYVGVGWTTGSDGRPSKIGLMSTNGSGMSPTFVTGSAKVKDALNREGLTLPAFSKGHWADGDHQMIALLPTGSAVNMEYPGYSINAINLETGATSTVATGDDPSQMPGAPAWSHKGDTIIYARGTGDSSGYQMTNGDLRVVPFKDGTGGTSTALAGASDPQRNEYFPAFSPDDKLIAFSSLPQGTSNYPPANAPAEIMLVKSDGSTPTAQRILANDPATCGNARSPGITNSWPKWAPEVTVVGAKTYYWLTFSSKRGNGVTPQLYVTPVVVEGGTITTYPALYLYNQPANEGNHTPAWDNFDIPIS
jgi:hypothetical protein